MLRGICRPVRDVTCILEAARQGDPTAADQLLPLVYHELRRLAAHKMANEAGPQTLQPTALVHEAWLRLAGNESQRWDGRAHFFAAAAEAMRHILIDHARRKQALRHGGGQHRVDADEVEIAAPAGDDELLAVNDALDRLALADPAKAELVKLRYFVGMTMEEAAAALDISEPTAKRRWAMARAWLFNEIRSQRHSRAGPSAK
jgi:RNA polymerase sigma factor (TIGR02999 family)